ncbi:MAG: hypothetical protein KY455_07760 [Euryarchaeota archaeon]|nr:hypothetical protein [Euryarchaeota archaeon]
MRNLLLILLLSTAAFSGCVSDDPLAKLDDGPSLMVDVPKTYEWSLDRCDAVVGVVHTAKENLQPHVPEGWRVAAPEEQGGPADPRGDAALGVEVFLCDDITAANLTDGNSSAMKKAAYASYWTWVEPPEEYRKDDVMFHFWKWDTLVADETLRAELVAEGLPIVNGTADWDGDTDTGMSTFVNSPAGPVAYQVKLDWEEGVIGFNGVAGAPFEPKEFSFVEYQATADGRIAEWTTDAVGDFVNIGVGYVKFNPGTWGHDVTGLERSPAYFFAGDWSFTNGKLLIPPRVDTGAGNTTAGA